MEAATEARIKRILAAKGIDSTNYFSENAAKDHERKEPTPRAKALRDIFYNTLGTAAASLSCRTSLWQTC